MSKPYFAVCFPCGIYIFCFNFWPVARSSSCSKREYSFKSL